MKYFLSLALLLSLRLAATDFELGQGISNKRDVLWEATAEDLAAIFGNRLKPLDSNKNILRCRPDSGDRLLFFGLPLDEITARLEKDKLKQLTLRINNRGDSGTVSENNFQTMARDVGSKISPMLGGASPASQIAQPMANREKMLAAVWKTGQLDLVLRWRSSIKRSEYLALDFYPPGESPTSLQLEQPN